MAVHDIFSSRNGPTTTINNHVGNTGRLFYDESTGALRISDGVTPGGNQLPMIIASATEVGGVRPSNSFAVDAFGNMTLRPATSTRIGGIKAGPGINIASDGTLVIDTEGLSFSFGDFFAYTDSGPDSTVAAYLSSINENQDIVLESNGTGSISIVGKFNIFPPDGSISDRDPVFRVDEVGSISANSLDIQEFSPIGNQCALNVTINEQGLTKIPTVLSGGVAQFTGRDNRTPSLILDAYGLGEQSSQYGGQFVFRTGRGTNASPLAIQSGDLLGEVVATGWASNGYGGKASGFYKIVANENFTSTARGGRLEMWVVPNTTITEQKIVTIDSTGLSMATGTVALAAGTTTSAPLKLQSGTNLATASAGNIEYDGKVIYATPSDAQRSIVRAEQLFSLNTNRTYTPGNSNPASVLGVGVSVSANTRYWFRIKLFVTRNGGANNHAATLAWGGNATLSRITYSVISSITGATPGAASLMDNSATTNFGTGVAVTAAGNQDVAYSLLITGIVDVTNSGTLIPEIGWADGINPGTVTVFAPSMMLIYPISATGANTSVGTWA